MGCSNSKQSVDGVLPGAVQRAAAAASEGQVAQNTDPGHKPKKARQLPDDGGPDVVHSAIRFADGKGMPLAQPLSPNGSAWNSASQPRKTLLKSSSYVGSALLQLARKNAALQPVCIALGACVAQAMSARVLKLDCCRLAKLLEEVENALVKVASDASVLAQCDTMLQQLMRVLDDAMQLLARLKSPLQMGDVGRDVAQLAASGALPALRDRILSTIKELDAATWLAGGELDVIARTTFKESKAVAAAVADAGGFESLEGSSGQVSSTAVASSLSASCRSSDAADDILDVNAITAILDYDGPAYSAPGITPSGPPSAPPCLIMGKPAPEEEVTAVVMHAQVRQVQAVMDAGWGGATITPSAFFHKFPLAVGEVPRLAYIAQHGLEGVWQEVDLADIMAELRTRLAAPYVAAYIVGMSSNTLLACAVDGTLLGAEPGSVMTQRGRVQARKFSLCQHTIASPDNVHRVPTERVPECFDGSIFANAALRGTDPGVADMAARLANHTDPLIDDFVQVVQNGAAAMAQGMPIQHLGVPLVLDGHRVGTICILHPPEKSTEAEVAATSAAGDITGRIAAAIQKRSSGSVLGVTNSGSHSRKGSTTMLSTGYNGNSANGNSGGMHTM